MSEITDQEAEFLDALEKLTRRTGIAISGCGCCGSPFLCEARGVSNPASGYGYGESDVRWLTPDIEEEWQKHGWEKYGHTVRHWRE